LIESLVSDTQDFEYFEYAIQRCDTVVWYIGTTISGEPVAYICANIGKDKSCPVTCQTGAEGR
jgi:hypothetical protein